MTRVSILTTVAALLISLHSPKAAASEPLRVTRVPGVERFQDQSATTTAPKKSFFKSRRGILIVSLSALAVGFTLWSKQHDRVSSPVR